MARAYSPLVALTIVLSASIAHAALPSAAKMMAQVTSMQPSPTPFVVNYVEAPVDGVALLAVRVIADGAGRARIDMQDLQGGLSRSSFFGPTARGAIQSIDRAPIWLQWWMGRPVAEIATAAGVMVSTRSLSHADGEILWVLGAGPRQPDAPQLQLERETGRLRRAVSGEDGGPVAPARLDDFVQREGVETRFPKHLTLRVNRRDVMLVNTWLRVGDAAKIAPEELVPSTAR
jgi:hypothetical protein